MEYQHYAAIDIGSNAVRLLIKRLDDHSEARFSKDVMMRVPLRLGQDVFTSGVISERKHSDLVALMKAYAIVISLYEIPPERLRVCATQALREAANTTAIVADIKRETGYNVEVISGDEEATIVCALREATDKRSLIYIDVGGGSTEVSLLHGGHALGRQSFPIGTVKIINGVVKPGWQEWLARSVQAMTLEVQHAGHQAGAFEGATIVGAGGNINKLFAMAQDRDAKLCTLTVGSLRALANELRPLSVEERMRRFKLKADRADVIVPAADIFLTIADALHVAEIEIPTDGLADGIIVDLFRKNNLQLA